MINRVIWIILDSCGCGELPDAADFGDVGTNTIKHVYEKSEHINIENLIKLGIGNIDGIGLPKKTERPSGCFGKAREISNGKDTTVGHWEMVGVETKQKFPTYPNGFPKEIIDQFIKETGVPGVLGNCVASGTEIIKSLGAEHVKTRKPIVYTSVDSVFQIACHEEIYSPDELYKICKAARKILIGENNVARVIARPFVGEEGNYTRTANRRDFSRKPDKDNLLCKLEDKGVNVFAVGKIEDIFAKEGITKALHTKDNMHGVDVTIEAMKNGETGLIFTNLVEFDSKWGHRNDVNGYANGLTEFDGRLPEIIDAMDENDLLIINADHGCDPTTPGTDHTREHIPVIVYGKSIKSGVNLGVMDSFADIGNTIGEIFGVEKLKIGKSFLNRITTD